MIPVVLAIALQVVNPPDLGALRSELGAQLAIPSTCASPPMPDTIGGSAGTAEPCVPRADASRPTLTPAKFTTTAADGSWSITFDQPFATVPTYVDARVQGQARPFQCTVTTQTTTGASGKCFQLVAATLPGIATSLLGLVIDPVAPAAAGISVRVVARQ